MILSAARPGMNAGPINNNGRKRPCSAPEQNRNNGLPATYRLLRRPASAFGSYPHAHRHSGPPELKGSACNFANCCHR